ncbi:MAG: Zn-ribbon domain-containing OB-fold protein [Alphaproteobacteria bacterium]
MLQGDHMGMTLTVPDLDSENTAYFRHCARHDFHLQQCAKCDLLHYPPTTTCPFCGSPEQRWTPVEGKGTVYSYVEVHHAIQPGFKGHTPYMILLVELDTQKGRPTPDDALRVVGNFVTPDGELAPPDMVRAIGIGSRMRMVFTDVSEGLSLPMWTLDEGADQPEKPWRYPQE